MRTIASFAKGLQILETLAAAPSGLRPAELSQRLEDAPANLALFLNTLISSGYALKSPFDGRYVLSQRLSKLVAEGAQDPYHEVVMVSLPAMERLHGEFNENIILSVLNATHLKVIHELHSTRNIQIINNEEDLFTPHVTAAGKAILSACSDKQLEGYLRHSDFTPLTRSTLASRTGVEKELKRVRRDGFAVNLGEYDDDVYGVAAPSGGLNTATRRDSGRAARRHCPARCCCLTSRRDRCRAQGRRE
ncbi:MAG: IclR family transcriptional regulator [Planctomycetota bacterium]|jgi:DNA-binding IclR family transcriptional regulator